MDRPHRHRHVVTDAPCCCRAAFGCATSCSVRAISASREPLWRQLFEWLDRTALRQGWLLPYIPMQYMRKLLWARLVRRARIPSQARDACVTQPAGAHPAARPRRIVGLRMILRLVAALTLAAKITVSLCVAFASLDSFLLRAYQTIAVATSCPRNAIQICSLACMAAHGLPTASVPMAGGTAQHLLQFLSHCIC